MSTVTPRPLDLAEVRHKFEYKDGVLYWKNNRLAHLVGRVAGCARPDGYVYVWVNKKTMLAHRVIYLMHHGYVPDVIDHINQDPGDNRIENLRASDRSKNAHNRKPPRNNKSGVRGVYWREDFKSWIAYISVNGKQISLGAYKEKAGAIAARHAAQVRFGLADQMLSEAAI